MFYLGERKRKKQKNVAFLHITKLFTTFIPMKFANSHPSTSLIWVETVTCGLSFGRGWVSIGVCVLKTFKGRIYPFTNLIVGLKIGPKLEDRFLQRRGLEIFSSEDCQNLTCMWYHIKAASSRRRLLALFRKWRPSSNPDTWLGLGLAQPRGARVCSLQEILGLAHPFSHTSDPNPSKVVLNLELCEIWHECDTTFKATLFSHTYIGSEP